MHVACVDMHVPYSSWGGQQSQFLLPSLVACTVLSDNARYFLPWPCQARTPSVVKTTSCRASFQDAPARDSATGLAESASGFACASERSAKRPLDDQLRPVLGTETVLHARRPTRLRSESSNGAASVERAPRSQAAATPAAGPRQAEAPTASSQQQQPKQQRNRSGRKLTGKPLHDRDTNVMITSSISADEVLRIMDERGLENFNEVNLATAFHRLARVRKNL